MILKIFEDVSDMQMKYLYEQILQGREDGLRPRCLDEYIREVQKAYRMDFGESWRHTEKLFWDEVGKRYFSLIGGGEN